MSVDDLRKSDVMAHLLDALDKKQDIGHYGRLVFAMVGRYFMDDDELQAYLQKDPSMDEAQAHALVTQVEGRDYNPPKRAKLLQWQSEQDFPIIPNPDDPDSGNLYRDLQFPDELYEKINEYYEEKAEANEDDAPAHDRKEHAGSRG